MKTFYTVIVSILAILITIGFILLMLMVSTNIFSPKPTPPKPNPSPSPSPVPPSPSPVPPSPSPVPPSPSPTFSSVIFNITENLSVDSIQTLKGVLINNLNTQDKQLDINFSKPVSGVTVSFNMPTFVPGQDLGNFDQASGEIIKITINSIGLPSTEVKIPGELTVNKSEVSFKIPSTVNADNLRILISPSLNIIFSNLKIF